MTLASLRGPDLSHIDSWVFDLDNTLYPASCRLFDQIDVKMGEYVSRLLNVGYAEAKARRKSRKGERRGRGADDAPRAPAKAPRPSGGAPRGRGRG